MPQLDNLKRAQIIVYLQDGMPIRNIAHIINVNKKTVQNIKHKWETEGNVNRKKPTGRPKISTQEQDNALLRYLEDNPFEVARNAIRLTAFPASRSTASRRIKKSHLKNYAAAKKVILGNEHKQARVIFALNNILRENWNSVVYTDEKVFQSCFTGNIRVYRPRGKRFNEEFVHNSEKSGRFSVNVWAWLSFRGLGVCWIVNERFNAITYRNILENIMLPSVSEHFPDQNFIYQQDNCPVHNAAIITEWFERQNIERLMWPAKSPDINILENVWGLMTKKIYKVNFRPNTRDELINFIGETWDELANDINLIRNLYASIPNRLNKIIENNGAMTKY